MSSHTSQAFIVNGGYGEESRKNPGLAYLEKAGDFFDGGDYTDLNNLPEWYTEEFSIHMPHGEHHTTAAGEGYGEKHALATSTGKFYSNPLDKHKHIPTEMIAIETKDGYDLYLIGHFWANVTGKPGEDEKKVKDENGEEWDVKIPVMLRLDIVKDASAREGFKMRHLKVFRDTGVVNELLDKRNHGHLKTTAN